MYYMNNTENIEPPPTFKHHTTQNVSREINITEFQKLVTYKNKCTKFISLKLKLLTEQQTNLMNIAVNFHRYDKIGIVHGLHANTLDIMKRYIQHVDRDFKNTPC